MIVIGVDPGPFESAWAVYRSDDQTFISGKKVKNGDLVATLRALEGVDFATVAVECIDSLGMAMGADHIETIYWAGRYVEALDRIFNAVGRVRRRDVKVRICGTAASNDTNVRMAIMDRFGGKTIALGNKKTPGPLRGVAGDVWAALAVAIAVADGLALRIEKVEEKA